MHPIVKLRLRFGLKTLKSATEADVAHWTAEAQEALGILDASSPPGRGGGFARQPIPASPTSPSIPTRACRRWAGSIFQPIPPSRTGSPGSSDCRGISGCFPDVPGSSLNTAELPQPSRPATGRSAGD